MKHKEETVEAVVYGIKFNGVLVYLPRYYNINLLIVYCYCRYGIQGNLYMKNRNGLVISFDEDNVIIWREGI